jgi:prophage regulatory protein
MSADEIRQVGETGPAIDSIEVIPIGKTCWWEGIKSGRFPKPVKLSARCTAWRHEDIRDLIKQLAEQTQNKA